MSKTNYKHIEFELGLGIRYHLYRQSFFSNFHRVTSVLSLIFSTSAVASIMQNQTLATISAAFVAILQCIDLIFDTRGKAILHMELKNEYLNLMKILKKNSNKEKLKNELLNELQVSIHSIEIKEPPVKKYLLEIAHNDTCKNLGYEDAIRHISVFRKFTAQFL